MILPSTFSDRYRGSWNPTASRGALEGLRAEGFPSLLDTLKLPEKNIHLQRRLPDPQNSARRGLRTICTQYSGSHWMQRHQLIVYFCLTRTELQSAFPDSVYQWLWGSPSNKSRSKSARTCTSRQTDLDPTVFW
jgi:hypothetical protein